MKKILKVFLCTFFITCLALSSNISAKQINLDAKFIQGIKDVDDIDNAYQITTELNEDADEYVVNIGYENLNSDLGIMYNHFKLNDDVWPTFSAYSDFIIKNNTNNKYKISKVEFNADTLNPTYFVFNDAIKNAGYTCSTLKNLTPEQWWTIVSQYYHLKAHEHNSRNLLIEILGNNINNNHCYTKTNRDFFEWNNNVIGDLVKDFLFSGTELTFNQNNLNYALDINGTAGNYNKNNLTINDYLLNNSLDKINNMFNDGIDKQSIKQTKMMVLVNDDISDATRGMYFDFGIRLTLTKVNEETTKTYNINTKVTNGIIDKDILNIKEGNNININFKAKKGYVLQSIIVDNKAIDINKDINLNKLKDTYTFNKIKANHTIHVIFQKEKIDKQVNNNKITSDNNKNNKTNKRIVTTGDNSLVICIFTISFSVIGLTLLKKNQINS
ncbi:MAG: hypothetical protein LBR40_05455 [Bacilli bacterium]|jgi:hypothetical protein|nr:hypothetical protein [Bacilli bacterium]